MVVDAIIERSQHRQQRVVTILQRRPAVIVDGARAHVEGVVFDLHGDVLDDVAVEVTLVYALRVEDVVDDSPVQLVHYL